MTGTASNGLGRDGQPIGLWKVRPTPGGVLLLGLGWTAFDPTNNLIAGDRHIRVAVGRDYADVPPTRGVYKGQTESELSVAVTVSPSDLPLPEEMVPTVVMRSRPTLVRGISRSEQEQQQQ